MTKSLDHPCKGCQELEAECAAMRDALGAYAWHKAEFDDDIMTDGSVAREALKSTAGADLLAELHALRRVAEVARGVSVSLGKDSVFNDALAELDALRSGK